MNLDNIIRSGRGAVITGGASGIGLCVARHLVQQGMHVCIADVDSNQLQQAETELQQAISDTQQDSRIITQICDVGDFSALEQLRDTAFSHFTDIALVMNNAGIGAGGGAFNRLSGWQQVMQVNLWGVVHGVQAFTPALIDQARPAVIINTGSKQGITNPPGNAAYNVAKAGVRSLTESLAHELRNIVDCAVTAHLLVPGFTYTGLISKHVAEKPAGAWTPEQVAEFLFARLAHGDFYILCPDNDVSAELDHRRIMWNAQDIVNNRPALSRWHDDYAEEYAQFVGDL